MVGQIFHIHGKKYVLAKTSESNPRVILITLKERRDGIKRMEQMQREGYP